MIDIQEIDKKYLIAFQKFLEDIMVEANVWTFTEYLDGIGATHLYRPLGHHIEQYKKLYSEDIHDIFVSNDIADNEPKWETLWLFSEKYCVEMKNFLKEDSMSLIRLKGNVESWEIEKENYVIKDFKTERDYYFNTGTSASARLHVSVKLLHGQAVYFKALGKNCDFLLNIFNKYIKANQVEN